MNKIVKSLGLTAASALMILPAANASIVVPGATVAASPFTTTGTLTLLVSESVPITASSGLYTGILSAAVYRDSGANGDITCPAGNCLDFMYQFTNTGGSVAVSRETNINFAVPASPNPCPANCEFLTGGDFLTNASTLPTGSPFSTESSVPNPGLSVDRDVSGQTVGFSFAPPTLFAIAPGQTSPILVVTTDATQWTIGSSFTIDGGVTSVQTYQPLVSTATPEPASMLLIGAGLVGLAGLRRKTAKR